MRLLMNVTFLLKFPTDVSKTLLIKNGLADSQSSQSPSPVLIHFFPSQHAAVPAIITSALWHATSAAAAAAIADVDFRFTTQLPPLSNNQLTDHICPKSAAVRGFDSNWSFVLISRDFYVQSPDGLLLHGL